MADQINYDGNGNFICIVRTNPDGSNLVFGPSSPPWADYVAQNGLPPATGTPTNKPARIPLAYTTTHQQIQTLYGNNPALALKYMMAWVAVQAVNNPTIAADINAKLGTSIGFDKPNT